MVGDFRLERKFSDYKSLVLTFELISLMVKQRWLEHPTDGLKGRYSTKLSYCSIFMADYNAVCQGRKERGKEKLYRRNGRWTSRRRTIPQSAVWKTAVLANYTTTGYIT